MASSPSADRRCDEACLAARRNQLRAAAMRQNGNAACLECGSAEDGFLAGMREDCKTDRQIR